MRALQRELAVLRQNIKVAKDRFDYAKTRYARGITNELDVALAERYLATLQAGVAPLDAQIAASQHVIAVLLGQFPEDLAKELASPANGGQFAAHRDVPRAQGYRRVAISKTGRVRPE
jgi:outer membrane protein TolC